MTFIPSAKIGLAELRIRRLPLAVRNLIDDIESDERRHAALRAGMATALNDARAARHDANQALAKRQVEREQTAKDVGHSEAVEEAQADADEAAKKMQRIQAELSALKSPFGYDRILAFFESKAGAGIWREAKIGLDLRKGEKPAAALKRLTTERAGLAEALADASSGQLPIDDVCAAIESEVRRYAKAPSLDNVFRTKARGVRGDKLVPGRVGWPAVFEKDQPRPDVRALFFWLHGDALIERLTVEANNHVNAALTFDGEILSLEEREVKRAEIQAALRTLEFQEGALVRAIRADGGEASFRHDLPVAAVLGIERVSEEPAPSQDDE